MNDLQGIDKEIFDLFQLLSDSEKRKYLKLLKKLKHDEKYKKCFECGLYDEKCGKCLHCSFYDEDYGCTCEVPF